MGYLPGVRLPATRGNNIISSVQRNVDNALPLDRSIRMEGSTNATDRTVATRRTIVSWVGVVAWYIGIYVAYSSYSSFEALWNDLWVDARPSVAFMTIDTLVLYAALILMIAYESPSSAFKCIALSPVMGPAGVSLVLKELEATRYEAEISSKKAA